MIQKILKLRVFQQPARIEVQRCTVHKLRNLERHTPRHALEEVKSDTTGLSRPSLWNKRGKFTENLSGSGKSWLLRSW
jgi:transposase-like protein